MAGSKQSRVSWRTEVKNWLTSVNWQFRNGFHRDLGWAARAVAGGFPSTPALELLVRFARPVATYIVKSAIKDAARGLGMSLSDGSAGLLADIAVSALAAT